MRLTKFPSLLLKGPQPELIYIFIFYGLLILLGLFLRSKKRALVVFCSISLCLLSLFLLLPKNNNGLTIHFINVGQGDCILITTPISHQRILLDGGRKSIYVDMGKKEVIPYLQRQGYFSLDLIISSHGDEDHRGGLETVLDTIPVALVLLPPLHYDEKGDYQWMRESYGNLLKEVGVGDEFTIDGITFKIINPLKVGGGKGSNENSLVVAFEYEGKNILLTAIAS